MSRWQTKHKRISSVLPQIPLNGRKGRFPYTENNIRRAQGEKKRGILGRWKADGAGALRWGWGRGGGNGGPELESGGKAVGVGSCGQGKAAPDFGKAVGAGDGNTSQTQGRGGLETGGGGEGGSVWQEGEASLLAGSCATVRGRRLRLRQRLLGSRCGGGAVTANK